MWSNALDHYVGRKVSQSPPKVVFQTKEMITKHAEKIAKQADEHEQFLNKVKYCLGVVSFGTFCFLLGSRPQDIPYLYCLFFITVAPLRWIYYRIKKWHYYLLDFCYYANAIFMGMLLFFPNHDKLFLVCFSFSEGPLAWALIVWRCSLVFSSIDKIVSVLIHLLPGIVFFIIRWWDPVTFSHHSREENGPWPAWPLPDNDRTLWTWLFVVPLVCYSLWQMLYFLIVNVLRRQRMLNDPEVMTSYRELSRKAARSNNVWWRLSGVLGDDKRIVMYAVLQAIFTVATLALTVPMFKSYRMHTLFEIFKLTAAVWNGGNYFFDVMPRQVETKKKRKATKVSANGVNPDSVSSNDTSTDNGDAKRRHLTSALVKSMSVGDVKITSEDHPICGLCKRSSMCELSALGKSQEDYNDMLTTGTNEDTLRKRAGFGDQLESQNGVMDHFDRTECDRFTGQLLSNLTGNQSATDRRVRYAADFQETNFLFWRLPKKIQKCGNVFNEGRRNAFAGAELIFPRWETEMYARCKVHRYRKLVQWEIRIVFSQKYPFLKCEPTVVNRSFRAYRRFHLGFISSRPWINATSFIANLG